MSELCAICEKPISIAKVNVCLSCAIFAQKSISLKWLENEFEKHNGIIINTFKKEIMKQARRQTVKSNE